MVAFHFQQKKTRITVISTNQGDRSYVKAATPIPTESLREVRDLTGKNGEIASMVMRKATEDAPPLYSAKHSPKYSDSAFQIHFDQAQLIIKYRIIPLQ